MAKPANRKPRFDLLAHYQEYLAPLLSRAPFTLRITAWQDYPPPVLVVKERREFIGEGNNQRRRPSPLPRKKTLVEIGHIWGEAQRRALPVLRQIVAKVRDQADIPLELQRYLTQDGLRRQLSLPLDEEAGAKLGLIFRLQLRVKELDRVELLTRRVASFTREEAAYLLSRITSFGPDANRWAISGLRIMLAGQPGDATVSQMLERLRTSG
ncbi:MAG: hypothetical protein JRI57_10805 [Deltaproteobacteria bacterium]|nr:hypothetical protein [Deltaproteobacteria bacterium]MBW1953689.1 hypothetical protein [Deltaproteobacteria bacterium]MBW2135768.1 hypothetical protein [Deltaproteobacteria bacterium]